MEIDLFSNPIAITVGGAILLLLIYFWNKSNSNRNRSRRQRNFKKNYYDRKKEKDKSDI